jgi:hypothetical protein
MPTAPSSKTPPKKSYQVKESVIKKYDTKKPPMKDLPTMLKLEGKLKRGLTTILHT